MAQVRARTVIVAIAIAPAMLAICNGLAMSADMPFKAAPPPPVFSWTGCYLGGHIGTGWGIKTFNGGPFAGTFPTSAALPNVTLSLALSDNNIDLDSSRFLGG